MSSHPLVVGIAGGTSSGKTTVTRAIAAALGETNIALLQHDSYYKDLSQFGGKQSHEINFDHPDAYDTELLIQHIRDLKAGRSITQPVYSYTTYRRTHEQRIVEPKRIIIVEGILIFFEQELRDIIDVKVFVETDDDERVLRRIRRDVLERGRTIESVMEQYIATVKPMHLEFVEPSKRWADVIIPRGGENHVAIDLVVRMLRTLDVA
ncbi:MAG: uridine kinase [Bacteroidetes bacterium]|nr:uridine kinase [Bacteroidota bacterium]MCW5896037.1 uridine kinase [Bacteroidota bacterium]